MVVRLDAGPIRERINLLRQHGWGWDTLSRATGASRETIRNTATGRVKTIDADVAGRIIGLDLDGAEAWHLPEGKGRSARVDPAATRRELAWLNQQGWSSRWVGRKVLGNVDGVQFRYTRIGAAKAAAIHEAFVHLVFGAHNQASCRLCGRELRAHDQAHVKECWAADGTGPFPKEDTDG